MKKTFLICPKCRAVMRIKKHLPEKDSTIWQCPNPKCQYEAITDRHGNEKLGAEG
jgi:ssDNA-binding Zn-finger/Zn-ribbon topoisomerase 1